MVIIARGLDRRDPTIRQLQNVTFKAVETGDGDQLAAAFAGCDAVAHCAGINREHGWQTYARVHSRRRKSCARPVWLCEQTMTVPLISLALVRILSEGVVEPLPVCDEVPDDLRPRRPFTDEQIQAGLPEAKAVGLADCRWFGFKSGRA